MRILVITNLFFPDRGGGASVFSDLCFGLHERGWNVTVFTAQPYYPEWKRKSTVSPWRIQEESVQGVRVFRHGMYIPKFPSKLIPRMLFELLFGASLMRSLLRGGRFDRVIVFCPMLGAVGFAAVRKIIWRDPLWLDIQDIPAEAAAASGISRSVLFNKMAMFFQRCLFNRADVWSTISPVMLDRLTLQRSRNQPLYLCPNWLNGSLAERVAEIPSKVGRLAGNPPKLLYAGNIGKKQELLEFCQRLQNLKMDFEFKIHGNGGEAATVQNWVEERKDKRFKFGPFLDEKGFTEALHNTDIFVITEKSGSGASFIPSKLIPCISTGTPILAICDKSGPLGREMSEASLGTVVEWNEIGEMTEKIGHLIEKLKFYQEHCLAHSRIYSRNEAIGKFAQLLVGMCKGRR